MNKNDVLSVELVQDQLSALRVKAANGCKLLRRALAKYIGMADEDIDVDMNVETDIVAPETLQMNTAQAVEARTETQLLDIWVDKASLERNLDTYHFREALKDAMGIAIEHDAPKTAAALEMYFGSVVFRN